MSFASFVQGLTGGVQTGLQFRDIYEERQAPDHWTQDPEAMQYMQVITEFPGLRDEEYEEQIMGETLPEEMFEVPEPEVEGPDYGEIRDYYDFYQEEGTDFARDMFIQALPPEMREQMPEEGLGEWEDYFFPEEGDEVDLSDLRVTEALLEVSRLPEPLQEIGILELEHEFGDELTPFLPEKKSLTELLYGEEPSDKFWGHFAELHSGEAPLTQAQIETTFIAEWEDTDYFREVEQYMNQELTVAENLFPEAYGVPTDMATYVEMAQSNEFYKLDTLGEEGIVTLRDQGYTVEELREEDGYPGGWYYVEAPPEAPDWIRQDPAPDDYMYNEQTEEFEPIYRYPGTEQYYRIVDGETVEVEYAAEEEEHIGYEYLPDLEQRVEIYNIDGIEHYRDPVTDEFIPYLPEEHEVAEAEYPGDLYGWIDDQPVFVTDRGSLVFDDDTQLGQRLTEEEIERIDRAMAPEEIEDVEDLMSPDELFLSDEYITGEELAAQPELQDEFLLIESGKYEDTYVKGPRIAETTPSELELMQSGWYPEHHKVELEDEYHFEEHPGVSNMYYPIDEKTPSEREEFIAGLEKMFVPEGIESKEFIQGYVDAPVIATYETDIPGHYAYLTGETRDMEFDDIHMPLLMAGIDEEAAREYYGETMTVDEFEDVLTIHGKEEMELVDLWLQKELGDEHGRGVLTLEQAKRIEDKWEGREPEPEPEPDPEPEPEPEVSLWDRTTETASNVRDIIEELYPDIELGPRWPELGWRGPEEEDEQREELPEDPPQDAGEIADLFIERNPTRDIEDIISIMYRIDADMFIDSFEMPREDVIEELERRK